jgi:hypothetical protein
MTKRVETAKKKNNLEARNKFLHMTRPSNSLVGRCCQTTWSGGKTCKSRVLQQLAAGSELGPNSEQLATSSNNNTPITVTLTSVSMAIKCPPPFTFNPRPVPTFPLDETHHPFLTDFVRSLCEHHLGVSQHNQNALMEVGIRSVFCLTHDWWRSMAATLGLTPRGAFEELPVSLADCG